MLKPGKITPASYAWSFLVVIANKKDGAPRICLEYHELYGKMKSDRFMWPEVQEIFEELFEGLLFTMLDLFSRYWRIRLSDFCKEIRRFCTHLESFN